MRQGEQSARHGDGGGSLQAGSRRAGRSWHWHALAAASVAGLTSMRTWRRWRHQKKSQELPAPRTKPMSSSSAMEPPTPTDPSGVQSCSRRRPPAACRMGRRGSVSRWAACRAAGRVWQAAGDESGGRARRRWHRAGCWAATGAKRPSRAGAAAGCQGLSIWRRSPLSAAAGPHPRQLVARQHVQEPARKRWTRRGARQGQSSNGGRALGEP